MMAITVPSVDTEISVAAFGQPVADQLNAMVGPWVNLSLVSGQWHNYGAPFPAARYRSEQGGKLVRLTGLVITEAARIVSNTPVATGIPAALCPPAGSQLILTSIAEQAGGPVVMAQLRVTSSGVLESWTAMPINSWLTLDGVTWGL
jgi:hypothetical protein